MDLPELQAELEKNHSSCYGWALSCCDRDRVEAEEILQMVYLKILEGKAHFRGESSFKTWLFAVIRNTARSERRKNLVRRLRVLSDSKRGSDQRPYCEKPEIAIERSEAQARFQRALQQLPARQRETLHLVYYEEMSLQEAAGVMGISVGAVRSHYGRGKKRLCTLLNKLESDDGFKWRRAENPSVIS